MLLGGNPLRDIGNTKLIVGVMKNGEFLDRAALDKLLSEVEQQHQRQIEKQ